MKILMASAICFLLSFQLSSQCDIDLKYCTDCCTFYCKNHVGEKRFDRYYKDNLKIQDDNLSENYVEGIHSKSIDSILTSNLHFWPDGCRKFVELFSKSQLLYIQKNTKCLLNCNQLMALSSLRANMGEGQFDESPFFDYVKTAEDLSRNNEELKEMWESWIYGHISFPRTRELELKLFYE